MSTGLLKRRPGAASTAFTASATVSAKAESDDQTGTADREAVVVVRESLAEPQRRATGSPG